MSKVTIDSERCTKCGDCVLTCPAIIFAQTEKDAIPHFVHEELCISCGHCVAVCPEGAITHADFPEGAVKPIIEEMIPSAEQILEALRMRRSIRVFLDKTVEKDVIERIIDAATLAPSAHNLQTTEFIVVQDKEVLGKITEFTVGYFAKTAKQLHNPAIRLLYRLTAPREIDSAVHMLADLDLMVEVAQEGNDPVLRGAPCLLVCHAESGINFPEANAILALHNATLMAQALGLGSFLLGWVVGACKRDKSIPELLSVPSNHEVYGGLALGYPRIAFKKWMQRRPPKVRWL